MSHNPTTTGRTCANHGLKYYFYGFRVVPDKEVYGTGFCRCRLLRVHIGRRTGKAHVREYERKEE